jgi:SHAQKYF class myb-like DNA-binding protein
MQNYFSSSCPLTDTSIRIRRRPTSETKVDSDKKETNTGKWNSREHIMFICGLVKYGNDWEKVQMMVKSRTCVQLRSHCQKFFIKIKNMKIYENYKEALKSPQNFHEFCNTEEKFNNVKYLIMELIKKGDDGEQQSYDDEEIFKICKLQLRSSSLELNQNYMIDKENEYHELVNFIKLCDDAKFTFNNCDLLQNFTNVHRSRGKSYKLSKF